GAAATVDVRTAAALPRSGASTVPRFAVTRSARSGSCLPKSCLIVSRARLDSEFGSLKPPLVRWEATPPPSVPATTKNSAVPTSTALRCATEKRPRRASMPSPQIELSSLISSRSHKLRHPVHPRSELALFMFQVRPCGRKAFVGDATEQKGVACEQELSLEFRELIVPVRVAPSAPFDFSYSARVL